MQQNSMLETRLVPSRLITAAVEDLSDSGRGENLSTS